MLMLLKIQILLSEKICLLFEIKNKIIDLKIFFKKDKSTTAIVQASIPDKIQFMKK